jgi:hypothetical protein
MKVGKHCSGIACDFLRHEIPGHPLGQRVDAPQVLQQFHLQLDQFQMLRLRHRNALCNRYL